jgi:hypothetical protein
LPSHDDLTYVQEHLNTLKEEISSGESKPYIDKAINQKIEELKLLVKARAFELA